jgi:hypothetical protein
MEKYRRYYKHLWYYWRTAKDALVLLIQPIPLLQDGIWPISRIASAVEDEFIEVTKSIMKMTTLLVKD